MEEFGITFGRNKIYWYSREMTEEVVREFIAPDAPHAEYLREIFTSLKTIDDFGIIVDDIYGDGADIGLYCSDKYGLYDMIVWLYLRNKNEGAEITGRQLNYSCDKLERCLDECGYTKIYDKLTDLGAVAAKVPALEEKIESLLGKIAALEADIAERRLRPGGEDYEAARERFTSKIYARDTE